MGAVHLLLVLFAVQHSAAQQALEDKPQLNIINGEDADQGEYPFMVRLTQTGAHHCGGSLISPNIILTAAHCLDLGWGDPIKAPVQIGLAVVGDHTSSETEETEQVLEPVRFIIHEDYYTDLVGVPRNDIALIFLKEDVTIKDGVVNTISLPEDDSLYEEGTAVTVTGWGINDDEYDPFSGELPLADTLQELEYVVANEEECISYWEEDYVKTGDYYGIINHDNKYTEDIEDTMLCTIDPERKATMWNGDSGGPLFVKNGETFTQIGVVSWGGVDPKDITYNMFVDVYQYIDWIKDNMKRVEEESWLELHTGASHGIVMVHDKMGLMTSICNDNVGRDEVNAICRERGYEMGTIADARDYLPGGRKRKYQDADGPPYGHTDLTCPSDAKDVMSDCSMKQYKDSKVPCFNGQQLAVKCANEAWSFKINHMMPVTRSIKGTNFVRGRVYCVVEAQKYGKDLDMKSQVQVGLVIRGEEGLREVDANMKFRKQHNLYVGKFKPTDEIKEDECFACIAYLPGTKFYAVGKVGSDDCPDEDAHYQEWVAEQAKGEE